MGEPDPSRSQLSSSDESAVDIADLHRGALVNALGYVLKLLNPVLLAVVTRVYGETQWGVFVAIQAVFFLSARFAVLGLDKALLWWVPRTDPGRSKEGVLSAILIVLATSLLAAAALGWALPPLAASVGLANTEFIRPSHLRTLRWVAASLPIYTVSELLIHATMGRRKMGVQVLVKGTLVPLLIFAVALLLFFTPWRADGLGIAFLVAQLVGLAAAWWAFTLLFRASPWLFGLPRPMLRYALPMWGTEFANTFFQRLDIFFLSAVASPAVVGIYGVLVQIGNQFRSIRQAFDPIAIAVTSSIGAQAVQAAPSVSKPPWLARLRASFCRAVYLVALTQAPVLFAIFVFASPLLSLFGEQFPAGSDALRILLFGWFAAGVLGLSGAVVIGFGRSSWTLANVLISIVIQAGLLALAYQQPGFSSAPLSYVALASAVGVLSHNAIHAVQAWLVSGRNHIYQWSALTPLRDAAMAAALAYLVSWLVEHALGRTLAPLIGAGLLLVLFLLAFGTLQGGWSRLRAWTRKQVTS